MGRTRKQQGGTSAAATRREKCADSVPAVAGAETLAPASSCLHQDELTHLLAHHRLPTPPQRYLDIFTPLFDAVLFSARAVPSAGQAPLSSPSPHEKTPAGPSGTASPLASGRGAAPAALEGQAAVDTTHAGATAAETRERLIALALPKAVAAYFAEQTVQSAGKCPQRDGRSAELPTPRSLSVATRKRARSRSNANSNSNSSADEAPGHESADGVHCREPPYVSLDPTGIDGERQEESRHGSSAVRAVVQLLSTDVAEDALAAFTDDSEYVRAVDIEYVLNQWCASVSHMSFSAAFAALVDKAGLDVFAHIVPAVQAVMAVYSAHVAHRLRCMTVEPRVCRVGRRLGLTSREIRVLTFLLLCHSGSVLMSTAGSPLTLTTLAHYCKLTPHEAMQFVDAQRAHMREGLVTSDGQSRNNFVESRYAMPQEAVAALTGSNLTEEQLIKLERTALAKVLAEEKRGAAAQSSGTPQLPRRGRLAKSARSQRQSPAIGATAATAHRQSTDDECLSTHTENNKDGGDDDDDDDGSNDLVEATGSDVSHHTDDDNDGNSSVAQRTPQSTTYDAVVADIAQALLSNDGEGTSLCRPLPAHPQPDAAAESASATTSPTSTMRSPYTSDFEYMEEAFKTFASLIKLRAAEGDMKDDDENFVPRTKIEATLRELKGKVRVSRAIHASRVAATLALYDDQTRSAHDKSGGEKVLRAGAVTPTAPAREPVLPSGALGDTHADTAALLSQAVKPDAHGDGGRRPFLPRIEQLARKLHLTELEKQVMLLMVGSVVSHDILVAINGRYVMRDGQQRCLTVGYILFVLCDGLQERVLARQTFYQSSTLVSNGVLSLGIEFGSTRTRFNTDLMDYTCDVDRKIVDFLMGCETETAEMVPGSSLYFPSVPMDNVILPEHTTKLVLSTIAHYGMFERCKKASGFGEGMGSNASGLAMLFYGPSGTGKTMLANAVAHALGKKLLLVNVSQFKAEKAAQDMMRFLFREAKLNDAVIFFDECESLFESRETNPLVTSVLAEFEKNDGLVIMATNKAQVIDEAMNRRISLMVEFKLPSHPMRESIWQRHMPKHITVDSDVSLEKLALDYELSGGLIRNAVLAALSHAIARENTELPTLRMEDLEGGARLQLRGFFLAAARPGLGGGAGGIGGGGGGGGASGSFFGRAASAGGGSGAGGVGSTSGMSGSDRYITPRQTLTELVMDAATKRRVESIARMAKCRSTLVSQWGFSEDACLDQGSLYLLSGPSGTGKSLAAEGIAYECGATVRLCNVSELLLLCELNVAAVFEEGRQLGAVVVFDEAQDLFTHSEKGQHISQLIQYYAAHYPKPVLVIATTGGGAGTGRGIGMGDGGLGNSNSIDVRASRFVFTDHIVFRLPDRSLRRQLWRGAFPDKVPLASDVDFETLSERQISAKVLRRVAFVVCCQAAAAATVGKKDTQEKTVSMKMIEDELTRCVLAEQNRSPTHAMFA